MKTAISLPDELFTAADMLAGRLGVSRSELYARAVAEFLAKHTPSEVTARLDEVYENDSGKIEPALRRAQHRSLAHEAW